MADGSGFGVDQPSHRVHEARENLRRKLGALTGRLVTDEELDEIRLAVTALEIAEVHEAMPRPKVPSERG